MRNIKNIICLVLSFAMCIQIALLASCGGGNDSTSKNASNNVSSNASESSGMNSNSNQSEEPEGGTNSESTILPDEQPEKGELQGSSLFPGLETDAPKWNMEGPFVPTAPITIDPNDGLCNVDDKQL